MNPGSSQSRGGRTAYVVGSGEGLRFDWANDSVRVLTQADWTSGAVSMVEDTLKPGFVLPRHHHKQMTEMFYCLAGEAEFVFDGDRVLARPGQAITVPPRLSHEVRSPRGATLLTVFVPGGFDLYLAEVAEHVTRGQADEATLLEIGHRYDLWPDT
jgi:mannose-6-phosphate isomerase-like protein (cupin superfamily)